MNFKSKFDNALNTIGKKAEKMMDITKLKYSRCQAEKQKNLQLRNLGAYIYKTQQTNKINFDKVADFVSEIQKIEEEIRQLNKRITQRQGL